MTIHSEPLTCQPPPANTAQNGNLIAGRFVEGKGGLTRRIMNPADTTELVGAVREASMEQVDDACQAAAQAFQVWRAIPALERVRVLFAFRQLLEKNFDDLARLLVRENGKLLSEARGDLRRGIDVVEFACGIPSHLPGGSMPEVSRNVDSFCTREPLGVVAGIPPFNFPAMIPLWMMPVAVACGNAFILKPAEKAPLTGTRLAELFSAAGLPTGVISVVQGGKEVAERLIASPHVQAVSFVGSTAVAESVFRAGSNLGKRVQALGGAKNHLIVMPDADISCALPAVIGSSFGCAGQRCLAGSVLLAVGDRARQDAVVRAVADAAGQLKLGDGMDPAATLSPVISPDQVANINRWIERGVKEGAQLILDGRQPKVAQRPNGCFVGPTVFDNVKPEMAIAREEVFGPVLAVVRVKDLNEAIAISNNSLYGNSASIFTSDGAAARIFRSRIQCGMLGVNVGVPAPMAMFSFGGWKRSLFGALHAYGPDSVEFYTHKKVVTERWFGAEAPQEGWI
jgi:malonate-semialdehyde dehydrogenase (acetylating)/methylmalonate-semialdehyde dehydrogenase